MDGAISRNAIHPYIDIVKHQDMLWDVQAIADQNDSVLVDDDGLSLQLVTADQTKIPNSCVRIINADFAMCWSF